MKKQRSQAREILHANQELGIERNFERVLRNIQGSEMDEDLASLLQDLSSSLACTAKAA